MQHRATWWPNERNMLDSTMLDDVASTCWIRLAGPLAGISCMYKYISIKSPLFKSKNLVSGLSPSASEEGQFLNKGLR